jgi:beta-phosphoglucomutase-like phosphatase (HAD superfamily)
MPLALLFDLDGTMVYTDPLHIAAWNAVLAPHRRRIGAAYYRTHVMGFAADAGASVLARDFNDPGLLAFVRGRLAG